MISVIPNMSSYTNHKYINNIFYAHNPIIYKELILQKRNGDPERSNQLKQISMSKLNLLTSICALSFGVIMIFLVFIVDLFPCLRYADNKFFPLGETTNNN